MPRSSELRVVTPRVVIFTLICDRTAVGRFGVDWIHLDSHHGLNIQASLFHNLINLSASSMNAERYISTFKGVLLGCLLAFLAQIFFFSPISPDSLKLLPPTLRSFPWNNDIQRVTGLGEGFLDRPESVCVDKQGTFYTATRDGWIKRLDKSGLWQNWKMIGGNALLGNTASGLLKVDDDGITILMSQVNGSKIRFADDASETQDGIVYFSDASTKFGLHDWYMDILEAKPHGKLLKYDYPTHRSD
ncbi:hypothetical protein GIB67_025965 [Kingdonia uniflora]|uniref:Strictosidine synthase conserved region domain-containing protein n=1 Tax=Kingdonia uniflora TaxID=39325 RepID=A0A7J7L885_9MAGN|nr:hypothetical protein GIB67_025965 [Kingdonia uniflora]